VEISDHEPWPPVGEEDIATTDVIVMAVRTAMEDFRAASNLDHGEMAALNRIIRNAILTALYAIENCDDPRCAVFVKFQQFARPGDWERPELLDSLMGIKGGRAFDWLDGLGEPGE